MTAFEFGDVVLVNFPFTDLSGGKQRPVVVISSNGYNKMRQDIIVMAISSRYHDNDGDLSKAIVDWQEAGLIKLSYFKPLIATLEKSLIVKKRGHMTVNDQNNLKIILSSLFKHIHA